MTMGLLIDKMDYRFVLIAMTGSGVIGAALGVVSELHNHLLCRHLSRGDIEIMHDAHHEVTSRFLKRRFAAIIVDTQMGVTRRVLTGAFGGFIFGFCLPASLLWAVLHQI